MQNKWLQSVPWDSVLTLNKTLCQAQKLEPTTKAKSLDHAHRLWETAMARGLSLQEVLDVCRKCQALSPFTFNNGNTFAAVGRTIIEEWTKSLPQVESQIVQTTVSHYIAGVAGRREILDVLTHFMDRWKPVPVRHVPVRHVPVQQDPVRQEMAVPRTSAPPIMSDAQPQT